MQGVCEVGVCLFVGEREGERELAPSQLLPLPTQSVRSTQPGLSVPSPLGRGLVGVVVAQPHCGITTGTWGTTLSWGEVFVEGGGQRFGSKWGYQNRFGGAVGENPSV